MKGHPEIERLLAVYADLSPAERDRVEVHLQGCTACAASLAAYRAMDGRLSQLADPRPDERLRTDFYRRLAQKTRRRRPLYLALFGPEFLGQGVALLFLAVLVATIWLTWRGRAQAPLPAEAPPSSPSPAVLESTATPRPTAASTATAAPTAAPAWQGRELQRFSGGQAVVNYVALDAGGEYVTAVNSSGRLALWPVGYEAARFSLQVPGRPAASLAVAPGGSLVAAGSSDYDGLVRLWNETGELQSSLAGHGDGVTALAFSPDGRFLASGSGAGEGVVRLWSTTGELVDSYAPESGGVSALVFSADGRWLAAGFSSGGVAVWSLDGLEEPQILTGGDSPITAIALSTGGDRLAAGDRAGIIRLWPHSGGYPEAALDTETAAVDLAFSADDSLLAAAANDGRLSIWQLTQSRPALLFEEVAVQANGVAGQLHFINGRLLAAFGLFDGTIVLWEAAVAGGK